MGKPLCIDLFCGLGGWTEGFLAEGYDVVGFDLERHRYPTMVGTDGGAVKRPGMNWSGSDDPNYKAVAFNSTAGLTATGEWQEYPAQLVLQDILTVHGSQFRNAACIVASPPCQKYSYMAMPWSKAKEMRDHYWSDSGARRELNSLFSSCFRIQQEASEAAGRYIPMVVENVKGAQPWVGSARWHYGSFYLWGDVPALMPFTSKLKNSGGSWFGQRDGEALTRNDLRDMRRNEDGEFTVMGRGGHNHPGKALDGDGTKQGGNWWHDPDSITRRTSSRSHARKAASAQIAKIPFDLARYIASVFKPHSADLKPVSSFYPVPEERAS